MLSVLLSAVFYLLIFILIPLLLTFPALAFQERLQEFQLCLAAFVSPGYLSYCFVACRAPHKYLYHVFMIEFSLHTLFRDILSLQSIERFLRNVEMYPFALNTMASS